MHSPEILKLLEQVLAPPDPASPLTPGEEASSARRAATVLDSDDDMGLGAQRVALDEDLLKQLRFFFPDALVLAAFDIIDRNGGGWLISSRLETKQPIANLVVIKYVSPLQRVQYQVVGTKKNCCVFPRLVGPADMGVNKYFCDCPAFTLSVLSAESNLMARIFRLLENKDNLQTVATV